MSNKEMLEYLSILQDSVKNLTSGEFTDKINNANEEEINYWLRHMDNVDFWTSYGLKKPDRDFYCPNGTLLEEKKKLMIEYYQGQFLDDIEKVIKYFRQV